MLSDVSSLTDLSSSEDEVCAPQKKARARPRKEWQPKQVLKAPRLTQYSTATLYEEILNGKVDLDPEYQRDVVWTDTKQSGLIDSILRNFYIPPIIFAFSQTEDGEERRTCIDGKQRLTSIQRFKDGQIPFKDSRTNLKLWYKRMPGNEKAKLLPAQYRKQFDLKQISCVEYTDINEDSEREIFQRVQLGVALTPAERMQAIAGPWPQFVREILGDLDKYRISDSLEWSKTRGRDFHCVTTIIYMMDKPNGSYPSVSALERWLQRVTPPLRAFKERVMNAFKILRQLVLTKKFSSVFQKPTRVSPIEFVMTVTLIDIRKDHTLTQLADAIRRMRKDVRAKHDDIRGNTKVTKTILSYIHDGWPRDLKKEPGEKVALKECEEHPVKQPLETGKRKRRDYSDSEASDSSEDDQPLKAKAKATNTAPPKSPLKATASISRPVASTLPPKSEASINVKKENATPSESRPPPKTDRLAAIRATKERIGPIVGSRCQGPTPPHTPAQTPVPQLPMISQNASVKEQAANIINNPNQQAMHPHMWPAQFNPQFPMAPPQYPSQMFQPNMPPQVQGQMMAPPSQPNATSAPGRGTPTDTRSNPYHSGPPTPNLHGVNGWSSQNDPNNTGPSQRRSTSTPTIPGVGTSEQRREGGSGSGSRYNSPHAPPTEPRGRGHGSPGMRGRPWYPGPNDRDRDRGRDREVLGGQFGGINGRDRDRDRSLASSWSSRNGR